jgi:hypothetical protein
MQVPRHRRQVLRRQQVETHQVGFSPQLPRQVGQIDAGLLRKADRQFLHGADGLGHAAKRPHLFREAGHRRFAHEGDVAERMFGDPRIDDATLEPSLASGDMAIEPPISRSWSTRRRDTATASGWNVPKAPAPAPSLKS